MPNPLQFRVSSALKNLIGQDLITDEYVAIFELVKNAYDANASEVTISFLDLQSPNKSKIIIRDNGKGMDFKDIQNKWLIVAYSAKREGTEHDPSYRSRIRNQRVFAGAKGVGRFSCDRLGTKLKMTSRKDAKHSTTEIINVDWNKFEVDQKKDFVNIDVEHSTEKINTLLSHGTQLEITDIRDQWDREKLLKLKRSLEKLVNPQQATSDDKFSIIIEAPEEVDNDKKAKDETKKVNGEVRNFIFERLGLKTTYIISQINEDGKYINTTLIDRGTLIYRVKENNPFPKLKNIKTTLFQLNRTAKSNFTRLMKIEPVNYGSVFMYKNGFRVYPFGEVGDDSLEIDQRKAQGYNRYLGLRDLLGRIEIYGSNEKLVESTSRDGGLIKNSSYDSLKRYFLDNVLKRLEKYTVDVIKWGDPLVDKETRKEIRSALSPSEVKNEIIEVIKKLTKSPDIIDIEYDPNFLSILEDNFNNTVIKEIEDIKFSILQSNDNTLIKAVEKVESHISDFKKIRNEYETEIDYLTNEKSMIEKQLYEKEKLNLFLQSVQSVDLDRLLTYHHDIRLQSISIQGWITKLAKAINKEHLDLDTILRCIDVITKANNKILALSKFTTKANFSSANDRIEADLISYIEQYTKNVVTEFYTKLDINILNSKHITCLKEFKPIEISVLIDNIVNNALKAKAKKLSFIIDAEANELIIYVQDDGIGLSTDISNHELIFTRGYTTTNGSGLGLYHIKNIVEKELSGTIQYDKAYQNGFGLIIRVKK